MQNTVIRWLDKAEKIITATTAIVMMILSILVSYQVFGRYVLKNSPYWIEEISVVTMMWIGLLGAAGAIWTDTHMRLEMVVNRLPETVRVWLRLVVDLIVAWFSCFFVTHGTILVQQTMTATLPTLSIPLGLTFLIVPIAGGITVLFAFVKGINRVVQFYAAKGAGLSA